MAGGPAGRLAVSCKSTELKRCIIISHTQVVKMPGVKTLIIINAASVRLGGVVRDTTLSCWMQLTPGADADLTWCDRSSRCYVDVTPTHRGRLNERLPITL